MSEGRILSYATSFTHVVFHRNVLLLCSTQQVLLQAMWASEQRSIAPASRAD